ncbi:hypothetical protein IQ266_26960 [filamentous cyanobacterium LEGE 11480]|uniref:Uncharacterized protein n=1 Tax=Romeriopsis navalis LEGE 11480 TaxID=2777977 RepID=A0A928Z7Q3_9CYAN|nr:hypothetical protein [Romeriopsis navalis]MBE9033380.1 hypothetical protein [Romeriopsis navalis LEGE 11480]
MVSNLQSWKRFGLVGTMLLTSGMTQGCATNGQRTNAQPSPDIQPTAQPTASPKSDAKPTSTSALLKQSPKAVAQALGQPIGGDTQSRATYQIGKLNQAFQGYSPERLTVRFDAGKAQAIQLKLKSYMPEIGYGAIPGDETAALKLTQKMLQTLLPQQKFNARELNRSHSGESLQWATYCVAPGMATSLVNSQLYNVNLTTEPEC